MPMPRRAGPLRRRHALAAPLVALLGLSVVSCTRHWLRGAEGVGGTWGGARACPTPPPFANPRAAAYAEVAAYVRARALEMQGLEPVQGDETILVERGRSGRARARAVPSPCAHLDSAAHLAGGRLLGLVTADGDFPIYGIRAGDTVYVWSVLAPGPGVTPNAAVLVNLRITNPESWVHADIDYHPEGARFDKAYARFGLIPIPTGGVSRGPGAREASLFRLASFTREPLARADTTGEGNTSAWFSCLMGCCRVKPTSR